MRNKLRVLLCSPKGNTGGITRWTSVVLDYYEKYGNKDIMLTWCYSDNSKKDILASTGIIKRIYWGLKNYLPFIDKLKRELRYNSYDVAHFTTSASISLLRDIYTIKLCKKYNITTVLHFHFGKIPQIFQTNNWEKRLFEKVLNEVDKAVVIDNQSFSTLKSLGYNNVVFLPNPLSPDVNQIITRVGIGHSISNEIVFAGHVVVTKGVFELVKACKDIKGIKLKIIGICSHEMRQKLITLAGDNYDSWLEIVGNKPYEYVFNAMSNCSLFILPTYTEGFPNVILESMACGCPIITTPVGAIPEMLNINSDKPCGEIVGVRDVDSLRNKIEYFLSHYNEAIEMGKRAQIRVNTNYSMDSVWNQMVEIWRRNELEQK